MTRPTARHVASVPRPAQPSAHLPVLVVAGTHSGCGKTTATLALMAALTRRGLRVQPMKAGPDYIDPGLHAAVTGRPGWNLDGWMCGPEGVRRSFARATQAGGPARPGRPLDAPDQPGMADLPDMAVIEGVMGLFDGASADNAQGSTAEVAALLDAPVLLVADVRGMSRSVAALVAGYTRFDPALRFAGVICNRVGGPGHRDLLRGALAAHCPDTPLLGLLARDAALGLPSRHLGLAQAHEHHWTDLSDRLADWFEAGLAEAGHSLDSLLARCAAMAPGRQHHDSPGTTGTTGNSPRVRHATPEELATPSAPPSAAATQLTEGAPRRVRIGIARDAAFSFLYPENLYLLEAAGAEPVFFSPLDDAALPPGLGGLLLPGGYPELYAARLSANAPMLAAVRALAAQGRPVHGECGGFMYLMRAITDAEGVRHTMAGCLPAACRMDARLRALGYRETNTVAPSLFGPAGTVLRGHEFHYSHLEPASADAPAAANATATAELPAATGIAVPPLSAHALWTLRDRNGAPLGPEGLRAGSASGSYIHLHFGSNPAAARAFVAACAAPGDITCP